MTYQGLATIFPDTHSLQVIGGTCTFTTAGGTPFSTTSCSLTARDEANSDVFILVFGTATGFGQAVGPVVSGGMQID